MIGRRAEAAGITYDEALAAEMKMYSLRRPPKRRKSAQVCVFLASEEAAAITGQTIPVNCGLNMWRLVGGVRPHTPHSLPSLIGEPCPH